MNRKIVNILLVSFVVFTLYNTLIPFHFQFNGQSLKTLFQATEWRFFIYPWRPSSITDIAGNILLFIPFGFLLYLWRYQRRLGLSVLCTAIVGLCFSAGIEFLQLFFRGRVSSLTDIFNNTFGTFLGALAAAVYLRTVAVHMNRAAERLFRDQPVTIYLAAVFILQAMAAIIPFNVSITVSDLKQSIKTINMVPFQNFSLSFLLLNRPTRLDGMVFNWFMFVEDLLFWSVWGYVCAVCYHAYWSRRRSGIWLMLAAGFMPGILLEFLQVFIVSRYCDINDIISNWSGVLLGFLFYSIYLRYRGFSSTDQTLKGAIGLYFIFAMFAGLQPFDFHLPANGFLPAIGYQKLIPFFAYFQKVSIWNISDLFVSLLYFFPIGLLMSHTLHRRYYPWYSIYVFTSLAGFLMGGMIEFFQLYSPTRVGEITDSLLYGTGGFLGAFSLYYFLHEIRPSFSVEGSV